MAIVYRPALRAVALGITNIFQTIPSLALFGFLIPLPFIDKRKCDASCGKALLLFSFVKNWRFFVKRRRKVINAGRAFDTRLQVTAQT